MLVERRGVTSRGPDAAPMAEGQAFVSARHLAALAEISQVLVTSLEFEVAIEHVIAAVARALSIESGGILLADSRSEELVLQCPAFGMWSDQPVGPTRIPLSGQSNSVSVFKSGSPYLSNDARNDPQILQTFVDAYKTRNILTVPLQISGRSIGVFHAVNKVTGDFDEEDLQFLSLIAPHLAIIVRSAEMMRTLRAQHKELESVLEIESTLSGAFLTKCDLPGLTATLAELLRAPVVLTDESGQMLTAAAIAGAIPADAVAELCRALSAGREAEAASPARTDHMKLSLRQAEQEINAIVFPIRVRGERLGYLAALGSDSELTEIELRALRQAVTLFAVEIIKDNEVYEIERRLQVDVLDNLFGTTSDREATRLLRRIGMDYAFPVRAGYLRVSNTELATSDDQHAGYQARIHRALRVAVTQSYGTAAVVPYRDGFVLLLPCPVRSDPEIESERLGQALRSLDDSMGGQRVNFDLGVGRPVEVATDIVTSFEEAFAVVEMTADLGRRNAPIFMEQLGVYRLLLSQTSEQDLNHYADDVLGSLLAYDRHHGTDWTEFLRALVDANFSAVGVARSVSMHLNTAKYRKRRIEELLGRDLDAAEARFEVQLALKILRVREVLAGRSTSGPAPLCPERS